VLRGCTGVRLPPRLPLREGIAAQEVRLLSTAPATLIHAAVDLGAVTAAVDYVHRAIRTELNEGRSPEKAFGFLPGEEDALDQAAGIDPLV
jgi:hypothetical protein